MEACCPAIILLPMNEAQLLHHLALTMVPQIGDVQIGILLQHFEEPAAVFRAGRKALESIPGIGSVRASAIRNFSSRQRVEKELAFVQDNKIEVLVKGQEGYPPKLEHCSDAPHVLFYKGTVPLKKQRIISIVGTRSPTPYGKDRVAELISALALYDPLVVSGLAYGIDTLAHKEAMKHDLATIGVLGHGLDKIYPHANRGLAADMVQHGGLLTEFMQGTKPEKQNFPRRNRIVAGMADAVIVVESGTKGGSLITADIANSYNRDVLAYPGRATDFSSMGCNRLIGSNKANLMTCGQDLIEFMNWQGCSPKTPSLQKDLLSELNEEERQIILLIAEHEPCAIDLLTGISSLKPSTISSLLLLLEMKGLVTVLPGKLYSVAPL